MQVVLLPRSILRNLVLVLFALHANAVLLCATVIIRHHQILPTMLEIVALGVVELVTAAMYLLAALVLLISP